MTMGKPFTDEQKESHIEIKLCDGCKKEKPCKCGRPTDYKPEFNERVDAYLKQNQDEYYDSIVSHDEKQEDGPMTNLVLRQRLRVQLPTVGDFATFLGFSRGVLFEWAKEYEAFNDSLGKIKQEQHKRLLNSGLSGEYNSTIAKLVLSSNHGYQEKKQFEHTGGVTIEDLLDEEEEAEYEAENEE